MSTDVQVSQQAEPRWLAAEKDYQLSLENGKLICQNPKGKRLASVPKWLKDTDQAQQLIGLNEWLDEHERECVEAIEGWMLRSLPAPLEILAAVWPDPAWNGSLTNLVVCAVDRDGKPDQERAGFLRDADGKKGVGVVDLDGETQWLKTSAIFIPHPILLDDLDDYRELAAELTLEQKLSQLFRETFRADEETRKTTSVRQFADGRFEQLNHVMGLCRRLGYRVKGGNAVCPVWENGLLVEGRFWVGSDYPEEETNTGELVFVDNRERSLPIADVGPVAFSEGMRMASAIYAKRVIEKEEEE